MGTLVEIGVPADQEQLLPGLWAVLDTVHARMSMFDAASDLSRLHATRAGVPIAVHPWTAAVLHLAQAWHRACPAFDVALGTGAWRIQGEQASRLDDDTRLDLGGLAKGWAVDRVFDAARQAGLMRLWVNAGGDLRVAGLDLPIHLRDERQGGAWPWGHLSEGAMATSDFRPGARASLWSPDASPDQAQRQYLSVIADACATADALTKVVAAWGLHDPRTQVLLRTHRAQAWVHDVG